MHSQFSRRIFIESFHLDFTLAGACEVSVRFIIGRAGTGKTRHCFDAIVGAMRDDPLGAPIFWILPKQATFQAERELTVNSGLNGFTRCRVASFDQLGRDVLEECGGGAIPEITPLGRQMLLGHLLRKFQPQLEFFKAVARQPGLASRLDSTFTEFDRCGQDPEVVARVLDEVRSSGSDELETRLLASKLSDFVLLYRAYHQILGSDRVDPQRRLDLVLRCVHQSGRLCGSRVYVDGFLEFTDTERRMLAAVASVAERLEITLLTDPASPTIRNIHTLPDELSLFYRIDETYRRLVHTLNESGARIDPPLTLKDIKRFTNPRVSEIERSLFARIANVGSTPASALALEMIEAADRRGEVAAIASRINDLLRQGLRLREIAVLCRDLDDYHEIISAAFSEHAIPFFADRRRAATHHPLLVFTRSLFAIARGGWPRDAVFSLIKSGLAEFSPDEADELENYVLLHRITGGAWESSDPWTYARTLRRDEDDEPFRIEREIAARMDALRRRLLAHLEPFIKSISQPATVKQIVSAVFALYQSFGVTRTLLAWIQDAVASNQLEQRGEQEQVWANLVELFDQMVDLLGDEPVELADFVEILESGLEQFDLALTPPTVDQVLVGQVDRTRATEHRAVFILGSADGQFPRIAREDSVLSDSERRSLQTRNLNVEPDSERKLLDENLYGYIAFTRAREKLCVTRAIADEAGRPLAPSVFWERLRALFPDVTVMTQPREDDAQAEDIATPRQLVTTLMRWAREGGPSAEPASIADRGSAGASPSQDTAHAALYHWLATHDCCEDAIDVMRYRAWRALSYHNRAELSPDVAKQIFPSPLPASVTRIECFAACPFKHFAQHGLSLRPREEQDVTTMDLGNVYHQVLERLVRECLQQRRDWCEIEPNLTQRMIRDYADEVGRSLRGELLLSNARNQYLLKRIEKTLEQVVDSQTEVLRRGHFRAAWAELSFGDKDGALPAFDIRTPRGNTISLRGKIDRVDLIEEQAAFAVIDYKLTGRALALDRVYHGLSLQLLTYLLVLQHSGEKLHGRKLTPVAAFYAQLLRNLERVKHPEEARDPGDPEFALRTKPRGIFDARYINALDADLVEGKSKVVAVQIKKDGELGNLGSSDAAAPEEFAALLKFVESKIAHLADEIIGGVIDAHPYRIGRQSPCPHCDYRSVCRFDVTVNRYHILPAMKRTAVLEKVVKEVSDGGN